MTAEDSPFVPVSTGCAVPVGLSARVCQLCALGGAQRARLQRARGHHRQASLPPAANPLSRSVAFRKPSRCRAAAARIDWNPC
jgi:hypothetical protein